MSSNMFINYDNVKFGVNYLQQIANNIDDLNVKEVASEILGIDNFTSATEFEGDLDRLSYNVNEISANIISTQSLTTELSESIIKYIKADNDMKILAVYEGISGTLEGFIDEIASIAGAGALILGYQGAADKIFIFIETNHTEELLDGAYSEFEENSTMTRDSEKLDIWKNIGAAVVLTGVAVAVPEAAPLVVAPKDKNLIAGQGLTEKVTSVASAEAVEEAAERAVSKVGDTTATGWGSSETVAIGGSGLPPAVEEAAERAVSKVGNTTATGGDKIATGGGGSLYKTETSVTKAKAVAEDAAAPVLTPNGNRTATGGNKISTGGGGGPYKTETSVTKAKAVEEEVLERLGMEIFEQ